MADVIHIRGGKVPTVVDESVDYIVAGAEVMVIGLIVGSVLAVFATIWCIDAIKAEHAKLKAPRRRPF